MVVKIKRENACAVEHGKINYKIQLSDYKLIKRADILW